MNRVKKEDIKSPKKKTKVKVSWQKEKDALEPFASHKPKKTSK